MKALLSSVGLVVVIGLLGSAGAQADSGQDTDTGTSAYITSRSAVSAEFFCSGDETMWLPVLAHCPSGTVGIATCLEKVKVPKKLTFEVGSGLGRGSFECKLDYANAEPTGEVDCDYSRCMAVDRDFGFDVILDGVPVW